MAADKPTFKLVLVGDGGTGKVSNIHLRHAGWLCDEPAVPHDYQSLR